MIEGGIEGGPDDAKEASLKMAAHYTEELQRIHAELDALNVPYNPNELTYVRVLRGLLIAREAPRR